MDDLEVAVEAARRAAELIRPAFGRSVKAEWKGAVDPVTAVDRAAEDAIIAWLGEHRPDDAVLGEETGSAGSTDRRWIIDPLDGTVNFVHGISHVSVSIALWEKDRPRVGVVLDVTRRELFTAQIGAGAALNGEQIQVSPTSVIGDALVGLGFPYDRQQRATELAAAVAKILASARGIRRLGSAALDLAYVAAGRLDGYWEAELMPWDAAAGYLLVTEAGGTVTRPDGDEYGLAPGPILASNGPLHENLVGLLGG